MRHSTIKSTEQVSVLRRTLVWLSRVSHCRGFGIQSPTDYWFERNVINERWPYYAYDSVGQGDAWLVRKLGRLYLRLANWRQPSVVLDMVGAAHYLYAGCHKAFIADHVGQADMACVPVEADLQQLLDHCTDGTLVVVQDIWRDMAVWQHFCEHQLAAISYDLYYCGIVLFDSRRHKQSYVVNF